MIQTSLSKGTFETIGDSGEVYVTDIINKTCTCRSWFFKTKRPCRHLIHLGVKE